MFKLALNPKQTNISKFQCKSILLKEPSKADDIMEKDMRLKDSEYGAIREYQHEIRESRHISDRYIGKRVSNTVELSCRFEINSDTVCNLVPG